MSALWTAGDAARATGGQLEGPDWRATGVSIDTRTLQPGDLFVALSDVRDGHDFVADALAKGAAAALVARRPDDVLDDAPLLLVDEVLPALEALGLAGRDRTNARVIGVTGSAGKTSTKEMLLTMLAPQGRTHASVASYNNHWGVPLTLARMPADTEFAIIEIGMNHPGEIAPLSDMARPHVALITTVAAAHLEAFEDVDGIAREKAAILSGLNPGGTAILPRDVPTFGILKSFAETSNAILVTFGEDPDADYHMTSAHISGGVTSVRAQVGSSEVSFDVGGPGVHFATNALAAVAAAAAIGADITRATMALGTWTPPGGRGFKETILLDPDDPSQAFDLIDDAFNANPASVDAALRVLAMTDPPATNGRRIVVLGDMLELGPTEDSLHRAIADHPAVADIDVLHCVGPRMRALWHALPEAKRGQWAATADPLVESAADLARPGDTLLIKGSKSIKVSRIVDAVRKLGHPPAVT